MSATPARVLIVDDSSIFVSALRHVLEGDARFVVVGHASDGAEAVERVRELSPDVVTMDLHMPKLSGIDAIGEIMAASPVPILVMTADPRAEERGLCFDALSRGALDLMPGYYAVIPVEPPCELTPSYRAIQLLAGQSADADFSM